MPVVSWISGEVLYKDDFMLNHLTMYSLMQVH